MDDIGVVMTPFGDIVSVILVVSTQGGGYVDLYCKVARGNDKK